MPPTLLLPCRAKEQPINSLMQHKYQLGGIQRRYRRFRDRALRRNVWLWKTLSCRWTPAQVLDQPSSWGTSICKANVVNRPAIAADKPNLPSTTTGRPVTKGIFSILIWSHYAFWRNDPNVFCVKISHWKIEGGRNTDKCVPCVAAILLHRKWKETKSTHTIGSICNW